MYTDRYLDLDFKIRIKVCSLQWLRQKMFEASSAYISFSLPEGCVKTELNMPKSTECFTNPNKTVKNKDKG